MKQINKYLQSLPQVRKSSTERGDVLDFFVREINVERQGTKYPPVSATLIAIKTSHLSLQDLYYMKSVALDNQRRNYSISKYFFGSLKPKPETP